MTMQPNFQTMSKKELRSYLLAHRDDDRAFYAYADRVYDSVATVEAAIFEWLKRQNPHQDIIKVPDKRLKFLITDKDEKLKSIKVHIMNSSIANYKTLLEIKIKDIASDSKKDDFDCFVVFVSENCKTALNLERDLTELQSNSVTKSSRVVGYVDSDGKFKEI
ncbi:MAG: hypothetical protein RID53_02650 [Coleofasciculus sp. B1-GNL1-01]|uniref:DUF6887 family protein n=1 Tax=Coleofasciculus sp. B1-GNL1-01 TaxID=3068484 RepID=UPI0032F11927